jgi:hypothetical protein
MANLTFLARRLSDKEENSNRLIIGTDTTYQRQVYFFWGLLLLFAISIFGLGVYGAFLYPGANLGIGCGLILLFFVLIFGITAKPIIEIIIDPAVETITITQNKIFLNDLSSNAQTFSLASLQKPSRNVEKTIVLTCTDLTLTLRFKNHREADFIYTYLIFLHRKTHPTILPK